MCDKSAIVFSSDVCIGDWKPPCFGDELETKSAFRDEPEKHGLCEAYVGYPNDGYESNYVYGDVYAYMLIPTLIKVL